MKSYNLKKIRIPFTIFILGLSLFIPLSCQKSILGHVEVTGRVLNSFTNQPESNVRVVLTGDDATSAKEQTEASITLVTAFTDEDGIFKLRSKPSRRGNYYITITGSKVGNQQIPVKVNEKFEFADSFVGTKDFHCKIKIISKYDSILELQKGFVIGDFIPFGKGTNTEILMTRNIDGDRFRQGMSFRIYYTTRSHSTGPGTLHVIEQPIKSISDTLKTTIYY